MYTPVERERIEAALKAAQQEQNLSASEVGRRLGKGAVWMASVYQRIRNGQRLTFETVRMIRTVLPNVEEHLKTAGWSAGAPTIRGRTVPVTRSTEHLRLHLNNLRLRQAQLQTEIEQVEQQIKDLEEMASEV